MDSVLTPSSPEELYNDFSSAAQNAGKEIREFTRMMQEGGTKESLECAKKSREMDGEGIGCWRVEEHADWLDVTGVGNDKVDGGENGEDMDGNAMNGESDEEVRVALQKFKEEHQGMEISLDEDLKMIKVCIHNVGARLLC